jgi:hypothetical protein
MDYIKYTQYALQTLQNNLGNFICLNLNNDVINKYNVNNNNNTDILFFLNVFQGEFNNYFYNKLNNNYSLSLSYSLKYFRNKIAHQSSLTLREIYRFIDETEAFMDELNIGSSEEKFNLENIRRNLLKLMINCNDNVVVIGKKIEDFNGFNDFNVEMKDDDNINNYQMQNNKFIINENKLNNYDKMVNKILQNNDNKNFLNVEQFNE